jgi:hypothetical protein
MDYILNLSNTKYSKNEMSDKLKRLFEFYQLQEEIGMDNVFNEFERMFGNNFYEDYVTDEKKFMKKLLDLYCPYLTLTRKYDKDDFSFLSHLSEPAQNVVKIFIKEPYSECSKGANLCQIVPF